MKVLNLTLFILALAVMLGGCRRVIESPRDELVQFSWSLEYENGNTISLTFDDGEAELSVQLDVEDMLLSGICTVYDDHFVICDERTGYPYSFGYMLHGDCVELSCDDGTLILDKVNDI